MDDHELAAQLLQDHLTATAALIAVMLKNLPDDVRTASGRVLVCRTLPSQGAGRV
jgi:hypothetical protein